MIVPVEINEPLSSLVEKCRQLLQMASLCSAAAFAFVWLVPACRLAIDMMILGTNFWPLVVVSSWRSSGGGGDPSLAAFIHSVAVCMFCSRNWQQQLTIAPKWPCFDACGLLQLRFLRLQLLLLPPVAVVIVGLSLSCSTRSKKELPCGWCLLAVVCWPPAALKLNIVSWCCCFCCCWLCCPVCKMCCSMLLHHATHTNCRAIQFGIIY